jgi:uncharacterized membrane protein YesL
MGRLADLMLLNLLFIVFSIPIFTIGASLTAMYYVTLKMAENEEGYIFRSFWKSFRQNFRQATVIWLLMLLAACVLGADIYILNYSENALGTVFLVVISAVAILYLLELIYIFPLLARFENKTSAMLRNAFIMAIADFPRTLAMLLIMVGSVILTLWNNYTISYGIMIWIMCGFAVIAFINSKFFVKIFAKYTPEEADEDEMPDEEIPDKKNTLAEKDPEIPEEHI